MLLLTGDHDDRVVPSHTLKFVAELQHVLGKMPHQVRARRVTLVRAVVRGHIGLRYINK